LDEKNPKGLTRALSLAMSEISNLIITDIYNVLQSHPLKNTDSVFYKE
jgi:hypothetical protein